MYPFDERQKKAIKEYIFMDRKYLLSENERADAIFIPGCPRPDLAVEAAGLYREGYAPLVVPSGAYTKLEGKFRGIKADDGTYGKDFSCEADYLEAVLLAHGVPQSAILKEREATYTLANAEKTREMLDHAGIRLKKAILCCKAYHTRRAFFYYSIVFDQVEMKVHPVSVDGINRDNWYRSADGRKAVLGELKRMGDQLLMMEDRMAWGDE